MPDIDNRTRDEQGQRRLVADQFSRDASRWSEEYSRNDYNARRYQLRADSARSMVRNLDGAGSRLLDVGAGAGFQAAAAHDDGWQVVGMDLTPAMIEQCRQHAGPRWLLASADGLPFRDGSFDVILMLGLIGYVPNPEQALEGARRCLRPGGHLVISCHNRRTLLSLLNRSTKQLGRLVVRRNGSSRSAGFYTEHNRAWAPDEFETFLRRAGFEPLRHDSFDYGRIRPFGRRVVGDRTEIRVSALLERLARRRPFRWLERYAFMHVYLGRTAEPAPG